MAVQIRVVAQAEVAVAARTAERWGRGRVQLARPICRTVHGILVDVLRIKFQQYAKAVQRFLTAAKLAPALLDQSLKGPTQVT